MQRQGDYHPRCRIRNLPPPLIWPVLSLMRHPEKYVYVCPFRTQLPCHQLWNGVHEGLSRSDTANYTLLQSDVHSGSCARPDEVSYQLREASLPFT
jgi:hypothetical protein